MADDLFLVCPACEHSEPVGGSTGSDTGESTGSDTGESTGSDTGESTGSDTGERAEPTDEPSNCPSCGSDRAYLHYVPALPDATGESFVKTTGPDEASE